MPTYVHILPFLSFIPSPHKCTLDLPSTLPRKPIFSFSSLYTLLEYILIYSFYFISPFHHPQRDYFPPTLLTRSFSHLFLAAEQEGKKCENHFFVPSTFFRLFCWWFHCSGPKQPDTQKVCWNPISFSSEEYTWRLLLPRSCYFSRDISESGENK